MHHNRGLLLVSIANPHIPKIWTFHSNTCNATSLTNINPMNIHESPQSPQSTPREWRHQSVILMGSRSMGLLVRRLSRRFCNLWIQITSRSAPTLLVHLLLTTRALPHTMAGQDSRTKLRRKLKATHGLEKVIEGSSTNFCVSYGIGSMQKRWDCDSHKTMSASWSTLRRQSVRQPKA